MLLLESRKPKQQVEGQKKVLVNGVLMQSNGVLEINLVTKGVREMGINSIPSYIGVSSTIQWIITFMTTHIKRLST